MSIFDGILNPGRQKKELLQLEIESKNAEIRAFKAAEKANSELFAQSEKAVAALIDQVQHPRMTLNDQLYGNESRYENPCTFIGHGRKKYLSAIAYSQSPSAQAMLGRFVDFVIGPRLDLQLQPAWSILAQYGAPYSEKDDEEITRQQQIIVNNIETRKRLWCKTETSDYYQIQNHIKRSREVFFDLMYFGEYICVLRYTKKTGNPLTIQRIKPENLMCVDSQPAKGNDIVDGIEYTPDGVPVAYHIYDPLTQKSERIAKYGQRTGRRLVIHTTIGKGHRGEPLLSGIISEITKISDFQAMEIQAAVLNALFAIQVVTQIGGDDKGGDWSSTGVNGNGNTDTFRSAWNPSEFQANIKTAKFQSGAIIAHPGQGQKLESFDTKRPTANFKDFVDAVERNLFSAKGMHFGSAKFQFDASYSAARGELLTFWNRIMTLREDHINDFEDVINMAWLWGEIDAGNIVYNGRPVNFGWYQSETARLAFCDARYTGPSRPDIDPLKSVLAHEKEMKYGWKTSAMITAERNGGDFDENVKRTTSENKRIATAYEPVARIEKTSYSENKTESNSTSVTKAEGA